MSPVWYLIVVIVVLAVAAVILTLRRSKKPSKPTADREAVKPPAVGDAPARAEAPAATSQREVAEEAQRRAAAPETPPSTAAAAGLAEPVEAARAATKVEVPVEELRTRVQSSLEDSERLLGRLQAIAAAAEGGGSVDAGMLEIMREGLEEVRSLAQKKKWNQAKDKGEALHAQLSLMLGSARREPAS